MSKVIDEIKQITANVVAKKNDAAKLNFPKIIEKIKTAAALGESHCTFNLNEMNEYDKKLLEVEGFRVWLANEPKNDYKSQHFDQKLLRCWEVAW